MEGGEHVGVELAEGLHQGPRLGRPQACKVVSGSSSHLVRTAVGGRPGCPPPPPRATAVCENDDSHNHTININNSNKRTMLTENNTRNNNNYSKSNANDAVRITDN